LITGSCRASLGWTAEGDCPYANGRAFLRELRIAGWAFDAMTGKGGGNEFFQTFHRGLLDDLQKGSGMLNVLPYMVPVKRETPYIVAQKC
jgi:hypothetical protein